MCATTAASVLGAAYVYSNFTSTNTNLLALSLLAAAAMVALSLMLVWASSSAWARADLLALFAPSRAHKLGADTPEKLSRSELLRQPATPSSQRRTTWLKRSGCWTITQCPVSKPSTAQPGCRASDSSHSADWN
jgi:hypothetical protein